MRSTLACDGNWDSLDLLPTATAINATTRHLSNTLEEDRRRLHELEAETEAE